MNQGHPNKILDTFYPPEAAEEQRRALALLAEISIAGVMTPQALEILVNALRCAETRGRNEATTNE